MRDRAIVFSRYAWCVLAWSVLVILWGAFVRATGSGAGCGEHWPLCNGEVLPRSPTMTTVIEFLHRVTSGVALLSVAALVAWAVRIFPPGHRARRLAWISMGLLLVEALLGAGLVLFSYVEKNASAGRAIYLCAHMTNTLLLIAALTATAWFARAPVGAWSRVPKFVWYGFAAAFLATLTGVIAALGDTIWPATSLAEGIRTEFTSAAPALLKLRLLHPLVAFLAGFFVLVAAFSALRSPAKPWVAGLVLVQLALGTANVFLLAPVWMQITHLAVGIGLWLWLVVGALELQRV
jgi:heme a synthase